MDENTPENPVTPKGGKIRIWAKRGLKIMFAAVLILHIYALLLRFVPIPGTILMAQRAMAGETIQRDWTAIEHKSPHLVYSVIGAEDSRYCEHHGIDWEAVQTVLDERGPGGGREALAGPRGATLSTWPLSAPRCHSVWFPARAGAPYLLIPHFVLSCSSSPFCVLLFVCLLCRPLLLPLLF